MVKKELTKKICRRKKCLICRKRNRAIWQEEVLADQSYGLADAVTVVEREDPTMCGVCIASYQKAGEPKTPDAIVKWVSKRVWVLNSVARRAEHMYYHISSEGG